jgi:hypothetical protein
VLQQPGQAYRDGDQAEGDLHVVDLWQGVETLLGATLRGWRRPS